MQDGCTSLPSAVVPFRCRNIDAWQVSSAAQHASLLWYECMYELSKDYGMTEYYSRKDQREDTIVKALLKPAGSGYEDR